MKTSKAHLFELSYSINCFVSAGVTKYAPRKWNTYCSPNKQQMKAFYTGNAEICAVYCTMKMECVSFSYNPISGKTPFKLASLYDNSCVTLKCGHSLVAMQCESCYRMHYC